MAYESLRIPIFCVKVSVPQLKRFGNGGYLKPGHENANPFLNHNFSTLWAPPTRAHKFCGVPIQAPGIFRLNGFPFKSYKNLNQRGPPKKLK